MSDKFKTLMEEYEAASQQLQEAVGHLLELSVEVLDMAIDIKNGDA
jgi:hypothetical protein